MIRHVGLAIAFVLAACGQGLSPLSGGSASVIAEPCDTGVSLDVLCAKQDDVRQGEGSADLTRVVVGASATRLVGPRYVRATGSGAFDLRLGVEAICTSSASSKGETVVRTREPAGTLLTLLRGRAICTVIGNSVVRLAGYSVLNADGSVALLDHIGDIATPRDATAQFIVDIDEFGQARVRAFTDLRLILPDSSEVALRKGDGIVLTRLGRVVERSANGSPTGTEALTLNSQGRALR